MHTILNLRLSFHLLKNDEETKDNEKAEEEAKREERHCSEVELALFPFVDVDSPERRVL